LGCQAVTETMRPMMSFFSLDSGFINDTGNYTGQSGNGYGRGALAVRKIVLLSDLGRPF